MNVKEKLHETLSEHLERIAALYKTRPKITLIIRVPGKPDQSVFLSDDNFEEARAAVAYLETHASYHAGPPEPQRDVPALDGDGRDGATPGTFEG